MLNKIFKSLLCASIILTISCSGEREDKNRLFGGNSGTIGRVVHIVDGDTYDLLTDENEKIRVRMEGIDTPERGMPYYRVAKDYLGELCRDKLVMLVGSEKDRYGRTLGYSYLEDGTELGEAMISAGMAWHFKKYNDSDKLAELEIEARSKRLGLWKDENPMPPWEKRRKK
jgi:micrococcal nuclease